MPSIVQSHFLNEGETMPEIVDQKPFLSRPVRLGRYLPREPWWRSDWPWLLWWDEDNAYLCLYRADIAAVLTCRQFSLPQRSCPCTWSQFASTMLGDNWILVFGAELQEWVDVNLLQIRILTRTVVRGGPTRVVQSSCRNGDGCVGDWCFMHVSNGTLIHWRTRMWLMLWGRACSGTVCVHLHHDRFVCTLACSNLTDLI